MRQALENDIRLEYLMIIDQCADIAGEKGDNEAWEQYLSRVRNAINMSDPANARNPFLLNSLPTAFSSNIIFLTVIFLKIFHPTLFYN